jgi:hypothetical protein
MRRRQKSSKKFKMAQIWAALSYRSHGTAAQKRIGRKSNTLQHSILDKPVLKLETCEHDSVKVFLDPPSTHPAIAVADV